MKEGKPSFYRIVAADLLAEIVQIPEGKHREWVYQFGLDLVNGEGSTKYAKKVIAEVQDYRKQQAENAGKRWEDKKKREKRVALRAITEPIGSHMGGNGNSSSSNNSSTEAEDIKPKTLPPSGDEEYDKNAFFETKKGRKLTGKQLLRFDMFWEVFDYKKGKAAAADSWIDQKIFTDATFEKVMEGAKREKAARAAIIRKGSTPIYPQGWLTGRRWEDEVMTESITPTESLKDVFARYHESTTS